MDAIKERDQADDKLDAARKTQKDLETALEKKAAELEVMRSCNSSLQLCLRRSSYLRHAQILSTLD